MIRGSAVLVVAFLAAVVVPSAAQSQGRNSRPPPRGDFGQSLPSPGLSIAFHEGAACAPIASPYGSPTRYDGSSRRVGGGQENTHGGIDLSLAEGTPLLAVAPGVVFAAGEGGMMEGIFLWIAHLPERTGLRFGFLSKYQHLRERPTLDKGAPVELGQTVAFSGKTGTAGGHYGAAGYPHLHLTLRAVADDKLALLKGGGDRFRVTGDAVLIDPLTIYVPDLGSPSEAVGLPAEQKRITVGYVGGNGLVQPSRAKAVWPVACP